MRTRSTLKAVVVTAGILTMAGSTVFLRGQEHHAKHAEGHEHHAAQTGDAKVTKGSVTGEVIDIVCYTHHDSRGKDHAECARYCMSQGIPLGILDEKTGHVYLPLPGDHADPNKKLVDHIAQVVTATGTIHEKSGLRMIEIEKVEVTQ